MSTEAMAIALHHSTAKGTARLVLLGIANHDSDGGAWPSVATLAKYAGGVDERTVRRCLRELEEANEIEVGKNQGGNRATRNDQRPNLYHFLLACPEGCDRTKNHRLNTPKRGDTSVRPSAERGDTSVRNGGTPVSPEPSLEPLTNSPREETSPRREPSSPPSKIEDETKSSHYELGGRPSEAPLPLGRPERCARHQHDVDPPSCGACGDARRRNDEAKLAKHRADQQRIRDEEAAARQVRRQAVAACTECDEAGYLRGHLCDHNPQRAEIARRGREAAMAALHATRESNAVSNMDQSASKVAYESITSSADAETPRGVSQ